MPVTRWISALCIVLLFPLTALMVWQVAPAHAIAIVPHSPISITSNSGFNSTNGVVGGNGSAFNPYIIQGWNITSSASNLVAITGTTAHVIIQNMVLDASPGSCSGPNGFYFSGASNIEVADAIESNANDGILISGSTNVKVDNTVFTRNCYGIEIHNSSSLTFLNDTVTNYGYGNSIYANPISNFVFENSRVVNNGNGAEFDGGPGSIINNTFTNDGPMMGLLIQGSGFVVSGNSAPGNHDGFDIYASNSRILDNTLSQVPYGAVVNGSNNTFVGNYLQSDGIGLDIQGGNANNVTRNYTSGDTGGISLSNTTNSTVYENNFYKDTTGLSIVSSNRTLVYHNNFQLNTQQASISSAYQLWLNRTYPVGGNYWSNYTGVDQCSGTLQNVCTGPDGIGDTPMTVSGSYRDYYPLIRVTGADVPPQWPVGSQITTSNLDFYSVTLSWSTAYDDTAIASYQVYENKTMLISVPQTNQTYTAKNLVPGHTYLFTIQANDTAAKQSTNGPSLIFTPPLTLPAPQPPSSAEVVWRPNGIDPYNTTIYEGQTVVWCNTNVFPEYIEFSQTMRYTLPSVYYSTTNPCLYLTFYHAGIVPFYDTISGNKIGQVIVLSLPPDFSLSSNPSTINSFTSTPGRSTITIGDIGYYNGTVNLTLSVSNSSLTCQLSGSQVALGLSTLVGLLCQGPTGAYNVTITGTSGATSHSTSVLYSNVAPRQPGPTPKPGGGSTPIGMLASIFTSFAILIVAVYAVSVFAAVSVIMLDRWKHAKRSSANAGSRSP